MSLPPRLSAPPLSRVAATRSVARGAEATVRAVRAVTPKTCIPGRTANARQGIGSRMNELILLVQAEFIGPEELGWIYPAVLLQFAES